MKDKNCIITRTTRTQCQYCRYSKCISIGMKITGKFIIRVLFNLNKNNLEEKPYLELLLSVAVGSQLGDVFLHLLPEAFAHPHASATSIGLWTLIGLFLFFLRFSPNKKYLVASSENCCIDIFEIQHEKLTRIAYVTHIEDPIMQIDWSSNSKYIRVNFIFNQIKHIFI